MCKDNLVHFPIRGELTGGSDDRLIREIRDLISLFQDPDLSKKTREAVFNEIIDLIDQLTD